MTIYRVGPEGATVFAEDGAVLCRLRSGQVVVPGDVELAGTPADQHRAEVAGKRVRHYPDKQLRPPEDKRR